MEDLRKKTKLGMFWNVIEKFMSQGIAFVLNIILARLLTPHDYGTIGMLTIFLTFSNVFIDSGFSRALIQKQERTEADFTTTLIFNVVVSVLLYFILYCFSPLISKLYKTPELLNLQRVFFLVIIINAFSVVQSAQLQIKVDFKSIAIINTVSQLVSGICGIIAAYNRLGPWALVIQSLTKASVSLILLWTIGHWFPKTFFSFSSFKKLFGFGSKLLFSGILSTTQNNFTNLVIGKIYSPITLGYYTRAQQFPELASGTLAAVLQNSTFPLLSSLQNNTDDLMQTFKKLMRITSIIVYPTMFGLAFLSKPLILVLLGEKWLPSADLLFWISLAYVFRPISILNMNLLNALGRSDLFLRTDLVKIPLDITMMIITFPIGIRAVVIGYASTALIYFAINSYYPGKLFKFGPIRQLKEAWRYILSSIIMACSLVIINIVVSSAIINLILGIVTGIFVYTLSLIILRDVEIKILILKFISIFKRG